MTETAHTPSGPSPGPGPAIPVFSANFLLVLGVFWAVVASTNLVANWGQVTASPTGLVRHILLFVFGAAISCAISLALSLSRTNPMLPRVLQVLGLAAPTALIYAAIAAVVLPVDGMGMTGTDVGSIMQSAASSYWIFSAWGALFLLVSTGEHDWTWRDLIDGLSHRDERRLELDELRRRLIPGSSAYTGLNTKWFWSFQAIFWSLKVTMDVAGMLDYGEAPSEMWRPVMADFGGLLVTTAAHYFVLRHTQNLGLARRIILALLVSIIAVNVYILLLWVAWFQIFPVEFYTEGELVETGWAFLVQRLPQEVLVNIAVFVGWSGFYLALDSARRMRHQEQQLYNSIMMAQGAQLKMLRFQINPHFLFNTLNAISTLVMDQRNEEAESMLIRLSRFLRFTLEADPEDRVTLQNELEAQELYLEIERARFQDRISVQIDTEPGTLDAAIPSLLLQPIVENTIKHGVSNSSNRVEIRIAVRHDDEHLVIEIRDNGDASPSPEPQAGSGVGLQNVQSRLSILYGERANLLATPLSEGGFLVTIRLPYERLQSKPGDARTTE